jgi:ketosteroid isomerase-like protein
MNTSEFSDFLEQYHLALAEIINGRPELYQSLYARRDDVTLANPFATLGPVSRGYAQVSETIARAAQNYVGGEVLGFENISTFLTAELGYVVEIERFEATFRGKEERSPLSLRVTTICRREDMHWRIAHRHADAITSPRAGTSLLPHQ